MLILFSKSSPKCFVLLLGWEYNALTKEDVLLTSVTSTHISSMRSLCKFKEDVGYLKQKILARFR